MKHPHNWLLVASIMWIILIGCALIYMVAFQGAVRDQRIDAHMKFAAARALADPATAARKLVEIAGIEPVQDGRESLNN
ncbi:hypothetical protein [Bradyrhizobium guangdongense]|nr:hypothetical protein [Bradyrhizobium guangdongense]